MVVRDVLSTDECLATIDDIWSYIETKGFDWKRRNEGITNPIRRDDPSTWDNGWPPGQSEGLVCALCAHIPYFDYSVFVYAETG